MAADVEMFRELSPYLEKWALPTEAERSAQRWQASPQQLRSFYEAVLPKLDDLLDYLDEFPVGSLSEEAAPWYHLALAFAEVAPHCELYGDSNKVPNSFEAERFVAAHGNTVDQ
ncbi:MAG: hypothetical protein ACU84Q_17300 [Gammaproteobacteria bacterium]